MLLDIFSVLGGCLILYISGDALLNGAARIGRALGWSEAVTGLLLVSLGTSAPELFVSTGASLQGYGDLAAGNVVGSNIVNIALVLGLGAMLYPLPVSRMLRQSQFPLMLLSSLLAVYLLVDGDFTRTDGLLVLVLMSAGIAIAFRHDSLASDLPEAANYSISPLKNALVIVAGIVGLLVGAELLIWGGIALSRDVGVSEAAIALTVTALGTSLPEIAATLIAVSRQQTDLAVGNVVGSNIMNTGLVLGFAGIMAPFSTRDIDLFSLGAMLAFVLLATSVAMLKGVYQRGFGFTLLILYAVYLVILFR